MLEGRALGKSDPIYIFQYALVSAYILCSEHVVLNCWINAPSFLLTHRNFKRRISIEESIMCTGA